MVSSNKTGKKDTKNCFSKRFKVCKSKIKKVTNVQKIYKLLSVDVKLSKGKVMDTTHDSYGALGVCKHSFFYLLTLLTFFEKNTQEAILDTTKRR